MLISRFTLFAAAALAGSAMVAAPAYAEGLAGTWNIEIATQMGNFGSTMTIAETGDGYTVEIVDAPPAEGAGGPPMRPMESTISDVAVDGSQITFKRSMKSDQFAIELNYDLTAEGDTISGKAGSDFGDSEVTGTRG